MQIIQLVLLLIFLCSLILAIPNGWYIIFLSLKSRQYFKSRKATPSPIEKDKWPKITLLLPVLNESAVIWELLENVSTLEYNGELQVLLLDDGSTDQTINIAKSFLAKKSLPKKITLQIIEKSKVDTLSTNRISRGKFENLNRSLAIASGEILGILDADAKLEKTALNEIVSNFNSDRNIVGVQVPWKHRNKNEFWLSKTFVAGIDIHQQILQPGRAQLDVMLPTYGSGEFWKIETIRAMKGWQNVITEDIDLSYRIQLTGKKVKLIFSTWIDQLTPRSFESFTRQQTRWAAGFTQTFKKLYTNIVHSPVSKKAKIDSVFSLLFYTLPAILYVNFLSFAFLGLIYNFDPLFTQTISLVVLTIISILTLGWLGSVFIEALFLITRCKYSWIAGLFWTGWLGVTGIAMGPIFFKAIIEGLTKKSLKFNVTAKQKNKKVGIRKILPQSLPLFILFIGHACLVLIILVYALYILPFIFFASISSYLLALFSIYFIFGWLSY